MSEEKIQNGYKMSCGPSGAIGGYAKWSWCARCTSIYERDYAIRQCRYRCPNCGNGLRTRSYSSKNPTIGSPAVPQ
jgi:PHP family Zn ribbon phosphoesterase